MILESINQPGRQSLATLLDFLLGNRLTSSRALLKLLLGEGGVHGDADGLHIVDDGVVLLPVELGEVQGVREVALGGHLGERGPGGGRRRVLLLLLEQCLAFVAPEVE